MQLFYFAIIITLRNNVSRRLSDDEIKFNQAQNWPYNYFFISTQIVLSMTPIG